MIPTFKGRSGLPFLSRGTTGILWLLERTVCAFNLFGLASLWFSGAREGATVLEDVLLLLIITGGTSPRVEG